MFSSLNTFFTQVLLFEGSITLLVPIQETVDAPDQRKAFPAVYRRVIMCIIGFYAVFGITCWMAFGDSVRTVLTTSLPAGTWATTVQLAYSIAVVFTFPLQNFPALEIATRFFQELTNNIFGLNPLTRGMAYSSPWSSILFSRNAISTYLIVALALLAVCTMDSLDKVVSLMGSLLGCPIAFVFPPLIHTSLCRHNLSRWRMLGNYLVASLGVVAMILASVVTLWTWN